MIEALLKLTHSVARTAQRFAQFPNIHIAIPSRYTVRGNLCKNHSHAWHKPEPKSWLAGQSTVGIRPSTSFEYLSLGIGK